jgi:hypothetical protein
MPMQPYHRKSDGTFLQYDGDNADEVREYVAGTSWGYASADFEEQRPNGTLVFRMRSFDGGWPMEIEIGAVIATLPGGWSPAVMSSEDFFSNNEPGEYASAT